MIKGVHTMFYSSEADKLRDFLRDKLGFAATDIGEGWLIFDVPEADMGVHPADPTAKHGQPAGAHDVSFYCDDINGTVGDLKAKGVEFVDDIQNMGYGMVTHFKMPGGVIVQLYEPLYQK
ncbi:MAG: VOC family protein [Saprospiraceae bacterium]|jgi:catechol 2,3-dioxygenase-like lactoylglutathione lyase family enzyme|nr:VOC family protein [Saprospiraceae bacterium]